MMNLVPIICLALGIKVGEEFKLTIHDIEIDGVFKFDEEHLLMRKVKKDFVDATSFLPSLLTNQNYFHM